MKTKIILFVCIILFSGNFYCYIFSNSFFLKNRVVPLIENGTIDLSNVPLDQIVKLDGEWKFLFNKTQEGIFNPDFNEIDLEIFQVPGYWDSMGSPFGINGTLYNEFGKAGNIREDSIPYKTDFIAGYLKPTKSSLL